MSDQNILEIKRYDFNQELLSKISDSHFVDSLWPLVYIISDENTSEAYVGETTDALARMSTHLKNNIKKRLTSVHLLTSDKFNKSATLDIESNLIKYMAADGKYQLLNGNLGLANHNYYQKKEMYWDIFRTIWDELKNENVTRHTIDHINNTDLFKYSPYKSLTTEQRNSIIDIVKCLVNKKAKTVIVEGGAGTGKTILATFLFKLLQADVNDLNLDEFGEEEGQLVHLLREFKQQFKEPVMALVVPMAGFRNTLKKVFRNIKGLSANMVIGPAEVSNRQFDILMVDESHRLRQRKNLGTYFGAFDDVNKKLGLDKFRGNELDWVVMQSNKSILFYDADQSIKPSDVDEDNFNFLKARESTLIRKLKSQFRVKGGNDYITFIDNLLNCEFRKKDGVASFEDYDLKLFDSVERMIDEIKIKNVKFGLSRVVAGYSWKWVSKRNKDLHDILIDDIKLKWNSVLDDYINSENAINEVGCIHTTQGYDLNYTGVIFGKEIAYNKDTGKIFIEKENYHDKNGQNGLKDANKLHRYIINIYKTLLKRGIMGTYIYVCDENLREYFRKYIPSNVVKTAEDHILSPYLGKMVVLPLYESIGCGELMIAGHSHPETIAVREDYLSKGSKYFVLRTRGDSMNKAGINDGDLVLCVKNYQPSEGSKVVALIGDDATIKEYRREGRKIILKPCSINPVHKPLIFTEDESVNMQGVVVRVIRSGF